nr:MAG TPA: hypothetical protein [Caudoviricetes sp.]
MRLRSAGTISLFGSAPVHFRRQTCWFAWCFSTQNSPFRETSCRFSAFGHVLIFYDKD